MTTLRLRSSNQFALNHNLPALGKSDAVTHGVDWSRILGSDTISSATWTIRDILGGTSNGITTSGEANASGISTAKFTAVTPGEYVVQCQMTDSSANIRTARALIRVLDNEDRY
jgi:hypothetical protein